MEPPRQPGMPIVGYVDQWSAHAGETLRFFVSSEHPRFNTQLVRLIHGDTHPDGPGFLAEPIECDANASYAGKVQNIHTGSCMVADKLPNLNAFTLAGSFMATLPEKSGQTALSIHTSVGGGLSVSIGDDGAAILAWRSVDEDTAQVSVESNGAFRKDVWRQFVLTADLAAGTAVLLLRRASFHPQDCKMQSVSLSMPANKGSGGFSRLVLGACDCKMTERQHRVSGAFNGRISSPRLWRESFAVSDAATLLGAAPAASARVGRPFASWNFVAQANSDCVPDESGNGFDAVTINRPTRLITGPDFSGAEEDPSAIPHEFNAAHFHDDDLADAGWEESFRLTIPALLKSGVYAMKLESPLGEDYIPFLVTTNIGRTTSKVAVLIPTVSYQVYANGRLDPSILPAEIVPLRSNDGPSPAAVYVDHHKLRSCYDRHTDGTGVSMATMLRPMPITVRPSSKSAFNNSPHQLSADLYLTYWLEQNGIPFDVVTDHELDHHGAARLADYNVVLSGTHAEYWTDRMLDGLRGYTNNGGRFMYLSGNGLYWVTGLSADGTLVEIRRDQGTRSWNAAPGEAFISLTGKRGGLWRHRGRAPQKYVGVGFASQGFDAGRPYHRTQASYSSRAAVFFEGIDEEIIGDFPAFVSAHGAAGYEFDRADPGLGTPAHAVVLASATGFSDCYQLAVEDVPATAPFYGGSSNSDVRADIVFFETPNGGAVFSTSSIAWCSALSYNDGDNNVSRLTENVVRRFMSDGPLNLEHEG